MKKALKGLKVLYDSYYNIEKGNPIEKRYKAVKNTAKIIWVFKVRPAINQFLEEKE